MKCVTWYFPFIQSRKDFKLSKEKVQSQSEAEWMPVLLGRLLLDCLT